MVAPLTSRRSSAILFLVSSTHSHSAGVVELFDAFSGPERVELADRAANGISVVLYWTRGTKVLTVAVADTTAGDYFELVLADNDRPLDVFYHPFAYASARGLELATYSASQEVVLDALDP